MECLKNMFQKTHKKSWFLVHKSASSEAQNMTTETYDNDIYSVSY